jgi:hypothetical protein
MLYGNGSKGGRENLMYRQVGDDFSKLNPERKHIFVEALPEENTSAYCP